LAQGDNRAEVAWQVSAASIGRPCNPALLRLNLSTVRCASIGARA
jgi:hypothetical protein